MHNGTTMTCGDIGALYVAQAPRIGPRSSFRSPVHRLASLCQRERCCCSSTTRRRAPSTFKVARIVIGALHLACVQWAQRSRRPPPHHRDARFRETATEARQAIAGGAAGGEGARRCLAE